ncbi:hypothetical protein Tco_1501606 [Tanacetum coccineum]
MSTSQQNLSPLQRFLVLKEKKKAGRPKKVPNIDNLTKENPVPSFLNNAINEFEMGTSNSRVVFNDGKVFNIGKFNLNNKKRGGSSSTGHLKMRGGKTKGGRQIPAQRLGRMGAWLGINAARSDTIENSEPLNAPFPAIATKEMNTQAENIAGTQQSQILRVEAEETIHEPARTQAITMFEIAQTRRAEAKIIQETRSAEPAQRLPRPRPPPRFLPPRLKSQRILNKKLFEVVKGLGSSVDNDIVMN